MSTQTKQKQVVKAVVEAVNRPKVKSIPGRNGKVRNFPLYTEEELEREINKITHTDPKAYSYWVIGNDGKESHRFFIPRDNGTLRPIVNTGKKSNKYETTHPITNQNDEVQGVKQLINVDVRVNTKTREHAILIKTKLDGHKHSKVFRISKPIWEQMRAIEI